MRGGLHACSVWRTAPWPTSCSRRSPLFRRPPLAAGLHPLADRRLLRSHTGRVVELRHPPLAEAMRRRLVGPEAVDTHRRIAVALSEEADSEPAEVAVHWRHADDPGQEIGWRIRAVRTAARRFAAVQESEQWLRVLELWAPWKRRGRRPAGHPGEGPHRGDGCPQGCHAVRSCGRPERGGHRSADRRSGGGPRRTPRPCCRLPRFPRISRGRARDGEDGGGANEESDVTPRCEGASGIGDVVLMGVHGPAPVCGMDHQVRRQAHLVDDT